METIHFSTLIQADPKTVWDKMLEDKTYRIWAEPFHAGSCYEGSWNKGSEIRFVAPDENGVVSGMFSRIHDNVPHQFVSIEHLGMIVNGVVDTESEEVKKWTPAFENYTFKEKGPGKTELIVEMQIAEEYKEMFEDMWPKALKVLKDLCEAR